MRRKDSLQSFPMCFLCLKLPFTDSRFISKLENIWTNQNGAAVIFCRALVLHIEIFRCRHSDPARQHIVKVRESRLVNKTESDNEIMQHGTWTWRA